MLDAVILIFGCLGMILFLLYKMNVLKFIPKLFGLFSRGGGSAKKFTSKFPKVRFKEIKWR